MGTKIAEEITENETMSAKDIALACVKAADDKKASDIRALDVSKYTSYTDYFVICSAPSERQVQAIVRSVQDQLRDQKIRPIGVEGMKGSSWVLLDLGSVVFHCFTDDAREYYDLEGFWIDAEEISTK